MGPDKRGEPKSDAVSTKQTVTRLNPRAKERYLSDANDEVFIAVSKQVTLAEEPGLESGFLKAGNAASGFES